MSAAGSEEERLRAAALRNAESILIARQRADRELLAAKEALEKKAHELRQQSQWLQVTLSSIGDGVIAADIHGKVTFLNPVAETMTGWTSAEAAGRPIEEVFRILNEDTRETVDNPVHRALQIGKVVALSNHTALVGRHGGVVAIEDSAAPILGANGAVAGAIMVFHDVTERRRAEDALRASEERFRATFKQAAVGIAIADLHGQFLDANERLCAMLGYSLAELHGLTFIGITHPLDLPATEASVRRLLAGEIPHYVLEKRYLRKDGDIVWSRTTATLLRKPNGAAHQLIGVIEDITERRLTNELRSRMAAIVESSDDAIISKTLQGVITTWNHGAEVMFGYTAAEVVGKSVTLLIPENHIDEEPAILDRLKRGERIQHYETVRVRKDGSLLAVSLTVSPVKDADGRVIGASKIARDITQRTRAEEALREETRALEILNATGTAIGGQLDLETLTQTVTEAATQLSGARFGAFFRTVVDARGEALMLYSLAGAPREQFAQLGLPRNTPLFTATFRGEGPIRSGDITKDPRYGTQAPHFGMPGGHLPVRSYLAMPVIARSGEVIGGLFLGHPDAGVFTARVERLIAGVAAQTAIAMDNARLFEAAQREIAQRERAEAALRETDRRKDEFLATLAHELRNPLAPIRQAALISQAAAATDAQKRWSHEVIARQVQHMGLLLDDLLDISRITRGTLELRLEMTELAAVVDAAVEIARPAIDARRHEFAIEMPPTPVVFAADPLRLAQVLANLLTNAAKYTDPGGRIRLRATATEGTITIKVADTGIGIAPGAIAGVFKMFAQLKSGQDRSEGGLGIGLALAKGLVELHDGEIEARSPGPGLGSEFTVRLPLRSLGPQRPVEPTAARAAPARAWRVLIADDNLDASESLATLLRMDGHEVTVVHDGEQALAAFAEVRPEVALLDIGMPRLNGYEVARRVRQGSLGRAVTLVAVTGWGQDSDKRQALAAGFNHHFTKPLDPRRLSDLLQSLQR